jgi:hypothetical protein
MPSQTRTATQGTTFGPGAAWVAPQCVSSTTNFASCHATPADGNTTSYLAGYNFGLNIPTIAVIDGLIVSFQRQIIVPSASTFGSQLPYLPRGAAALSPQYTYLPSSTPVVFTTAVQLWTGSFVGSSYNPASQWTAILQPDISGYATFLWNANLTPDFMNQSGFGFAVAARVDTEDAILYIQNFSLTAFYH